MTQIEAKKGVDYHVLSDNLSPEEVGFLEEETPRSRIGQYILGGCVAAVAIAIASSVFAGSVKIIDIGVYVEMVGADAGYVVEYHNNISYVVGPEPFYLSLDEVEVLVSIQLESEERPDTISVVPPLGWYCDPCFAITEEGTIGRVFIYPEGMS